MWPWIVRQWRNITAGGDEDEPKSPEVAMKEIVTTQGWFIFQYLRNFYLPLLFNFLVTLYSYFYT